MTIEKLIQSLIEELNIELELDYGMYYFYGSPVSISQQIGRIMSANDKYPACILFNEFPEKQGDKLSHFKTEAQLTLYLMTASSKAWSESKHIDDAVSPMSLIADMIIEKIEADSRFGDVDDYQKINRTNWGLLVQFGSSKKSVFPDSLSGVEIKFTLKVKRDYC